MGENDFDSDYVSSTSTSSDDPKPEEVPEAEVDLSYYDFGKPRRIVIRAKLTHGDESNP